MGLQWGAFARCRHVQESPERINRLLDELEGMGFTFIWTREPFKGERMGWKAFVKETLVQFFLAVSIGGKCTVHWCYLDGRPNDEGLIPGKRAFAVMQKYYKAPRFPEWMCSKTVDGKPNYDVLSSSPLIYTNPAFERKWVKAVCYDVNSAYGWAAEQPIPDTSKGTERDRLLEDGEIGFIVDGGAPSIGWGKKLRLVERGYANFVFPSMPSPYMRFVDVWFRVKARSKDKAEKRFAKNVVNEAIGYLQLVNPFVRAAIVERCNQRIRGLIDGDTVYSNTDSICSVSRKDLPIGEEIGQFKVEHDGMVAVRGDCYQWGSQLPTYRGVPKSFFAKWEERNGRPWDIAKDDLPESGNEYGFDRISRRLMKL